MGRTEPKAFVDVSGRTMLARSLEAIISSGVAATIVVAVPEEFLSLAHAEIAEVKRRAIARDRDDAVGPANCDIDPGALDRDGAAGPTLRDGAAGGPAGGVTDVEITAVVGGADRVESVAAALAAAGTPDIVLVHDSARALTPPAVFERVAAAVAAGAEAVVPVLPVVDTIRRAEPAASQPEHPPSRPASQPLTTASVSSPSETQPSLAPPRRIRVENAPDIDSDPPRGGTERRVGNTSDLEILRGDLDRGSLRRVQTPQGFAADTLRRAHAHHREEVRTLGAGAREATDDAGLVERLGIDVVAVPGDEAALKITYPLDLVLAEHIARDRGRQQTG